MEGVMLSSGVLVYHISKCYMNFNIHVVYNSVVRVSECHRSVVGGIEV